MKPLRFLAAAAFLAGLASPALAEGASRRERLRWAAQAESLAAEKNFGEAARRYEDASAPGAAKRDLIGWLPALGRCYEAAGNYQKAIAAYQQALELRPKDRDRMLDLARAYGLADLNDQAIELYERVSSREKNRKDILFVLAGLYYKTDRLAEARKTAERYVRWEPRDVPAQALLARIEEADGDFAAAAHRWEGVLAREPSAQGYFELGMLWARQGQFDLAESAYGKAAGLGLDSGRFHFERGLLAWRQGKVKAAQAAWTRSLEKDPNLWPAAFFLALADRREGRTEEARRRMQEVRAGTGNDYVRDLAHDFLAALDGKGASAGEDGEK